MSKITTAECKKILISIYSDYRKEFWKRKKKHKLPSGQIERIFFGHTGKDDNVHGNQSIYCSVITNSEDNKIVSISIYPWV